MEFLVVLLYSLPIVAVIAFLNVLFRIARALESIAQSMETRDTNKNT